MNCATLQMLLSFLVLLLVAGIMREFSYSDQHDHGLQIKFCTSILAF